MRLIAAFLVSLVVAAWSVGCSEERGAETQGDSPGGKPNIVLILADDMRYDDLKFMPKTKRLIGQEGISFKQAFVTDSLCCPSRATILTGRYAHNHRVLTNAPPDGGYQRAREAGMQDSTVATWLQEEGYGTALFGKYMNGYSKKPVPPGWERWYMNAGNEFTNDDGQLSENQDPSTATQTLGQQSAEFIGQTKAPFFLYVAPRPPHRGAAVSAEHAGEFEDAKLPRGPAFGERDVSDKPGYIRAKGVPTKREVEQMRSLYQHRLRTLQDLDDLVEDLVGGLEESGKLDETYVFFTSDHGYHIGEHRLRTHKATAYEEDIHVPLLVRGPGIPSRKNLNHLVLNNDLAPTFAQLAGAKVSPRAVDGRSLVPLISDEPAGMADWRQRFLVEKWGHYVTRLEYDALRTRRYLYVDYRLPDRDHGAQELYDLREDPHQLESIHKEKPALLKRLKAQLKELKGCAGGQCRRAEGG